MNGRRLRRGAAELFHLTMDEDLWSQIRRHYASRKNGSDEASNRLVRFSRLCGTYKTINPSLTFDLHWCQARLKRRWKNKFNTARNWLWKGGLKEREERQLLKTSIRKEKKEKIRGRLKKKDFDVTCVGRRMILISHCISVLYGCIDKRILTKSLSLTQSILTAIFIVSIRFSLNESWQNGSKCSDSTTQGAADVI